MDATDNTNVSKLIEISESLNNLRENVAGLIITALEELNVDGKTTAPNSDILFELARRQTTRHQGKTIPEIIDIDLKLWQDDEEGFFEAMCFLLEQDNALLNAIGRVAIDDWVDVPSLGSINDIG